MNLRGRQLWCRIPDVQAHEHFPYYATAPDPSDIFAYGDFCTYADIFTHPDTGAYKNVRSRTHFQGCTNTDNTAENVCTSYPNNGKQCDTCTHQHMHPAHVQRASTSTSAGANDSDRRRHICACASLLWIPYVRSHPDAFCDVM